MSISKKRSRAISVLNQLFIIAFCGSAWALDDIPVYFDVGAGQIGVPKWYINGTGELVTVTTSTGATLPIDSLRSFRGHDAVRLTVSREIGAGGYYNVNMKFPDDRSHSVAEYSDLRMRVKNLKQTVASLRLTVQNATTYETYPFLGTVIPADTAWHEIAVPLESFQGFDATTMNLNGCGIAFTYPDNRIGSNIDILIDDIRFTDGSGRSPLADPEIYGGEIPANWPDHLVVGSFDNRELYASSASYQAGEIRYQYIMPETWGYGGKSSEYAYHYSTESHSLGVRSGFVWYYLGKDGESAVTQHLSDQSYMQSYVDDYEKFLRQVDSSDAVNTIIVLEPDMYGLLMQKQPTSLDGTAVFVDMSRANSITGKAYPNNLTGWATYMVERARQKLSGGVTIGHMLNHWGVPIPGQIGRGRMEAHLMSGVSQGDFLNTLGEIGKGDVVFVEKTDRDAGVKLTERPDENWFWDDTAYDLYFSWVRTLSHRSSLRVVGWQVSEGNMNHPQVQNRDNAAEHFLANTEKWIQSGFIGVLFGAGLVGNANYNSDNDNRWFVSHLSDYSNNPTSFDNVAISEEVQNKSKKTPANFIVFQGNTIRVELRNPAHLSIWNPQGRLLKSVQLPVGVSQTMLPNATAGFLLYQLVESGSNTLLEKGKLLNDHLFLH